MSGLTKWAASSSPLPSFLLPRKKVIFIGFIHFVEKLFSALSGVIFSIFSFNIFLLPFPYFLCQKTPRVFRNLSIYNYWEFIIDNNVIFRVLYAQTLLQPLTGKGHQVEENIRPNQQLFISKFKNCLCKCAHQYKIRLSFFLFSSHKFYINIVSSRTWNFEICNIVVTP